MIKTKLKFLLEAELVNESNKEKKMEILLNELSRDIVRKRLMGIINGNYEPKLPEIIRFSKFFDVPIEDVIVLPPNYQNGSIAKELLEQREPALL